MRNAPLARLVPLPIVLPRELPLVLPIPRVPPRGVLSVAVIPAGVSAFLGLPIFAIGAAAPRLLFPACSDVDAFCLRSR